MILLVLACGFLLSNLTLSPASQPAPKSDEPRLASAYAEPAARIIRTTLSGNDAYRNLEALCDGIGHRLSGSAALDRAIVWAVDRMKADGQENVHIEKVMVPKWVRGKESVVMIKPREHDLAMIGLGGSVGTPKGGIAAPVVVVEDEAALDAMGDKVKGCIVLFDNPMPEFDPEKGAGYGTTVRFRSGGPRLAAARGAVACLVRSVTARSLRSPHTGATSYKDADVKIPAAAISTEDADLIHRLTLRGERVEVRLKMEARDEGMAPSANVIGELRGREKPEEIVVIGGHIDSWDVGQGAHDDGAGCVIAMEAINVLRKLKLTPRRTIRVVLWTNEENGLRGAKQYAADHAAELAQHVAGIESDSGGFRPIGLTVEMTEPKRQTRAAAQLREILSLLEPIGATTVTEGGAGADLGPMRDAGFALMNLDVDGSSYFDYHHSHADTLDKVNPRELSQCVATMAVAAYVIADMPDRLGD